MALAACFEGLLLNMLLGLEVSRRIGHMTPIAFEVDTILVVTTAVLAVTMVGLVLTLRLKQWEMNRRIGLGPIFTGGALTGANVGVEVYT